MISKEEKFACESCIRGHRVAQCQHTDRPLLRVSRKGRPISQCTHCRSLRASRSVHTKCKCASTSHQVMLKQFGRERCACSEGGACKCAYKSDRGATNDILSVPSRRESSTPSTALSPPGFEPKPLELAPLPLRSTSTERLAPAHCSAESPGSILGSSLPSVNNWPLDDMPIAWTTPLESYLPDSVLSDIHDPTGTGGSVPNMGAIEQAQMSRPTFDDPLSTVDILGLGDLFIEPDAGRMLSLDNSNLLDFQTTTCYDHGQWFDNYDFMNS
ncbi:copper fist DNA binding domain-containing protein [Fusarium oxysporum]|nr:copper fist DNA binding domain-containing protein [Fusarium oxysporum]